MCNFSIHVICHLPIPLSVMDFNDKLANLHLIIPWKSTIRMTRDTVESWRESADGQPRKNQYQHCSKKEICQYKEDNPGALQGNITTVFQRKIPIARRTVRDILKRKANWNATYTYQLKTKRKNKPKFEELKHMLGLWFAIMEAEQHWVNSSCS